MEKSRRNEELFDIKVGEDVRQAVFAVAVNSFSANHWVFDRPEWHARILNRLWERTEFKHRSLAKTIAGIGENVSTSEISRLTEDEQSRLMFGLLVAHLGEMPYSQFQSQAPVREIADEFAVDYQLLDAQTRVEKAAKKYKEVAKVYLTEVEAGKPDARVPRFWNPSYVPKGETVSMPDLEDEAENELNDEFEASDSAAFDNDAVDDDVFETDEFEFCKENPLDAPVGQIVDAA